MQFAQDHMGVGATLPGGDSVERDGTRHWTDEWRTGWADDGHGAKTETYPMESSYDLMEAYPFPDARASGRFGNPDEQLKSHGDFYVLASVWFTLFERLWMLRGFNNMLMDPYIEEANFFKLRDRVLDYNLAIIDQFLERKVDGIFFSDDWGSQRSLLMSPDDWRKYYKDAYRQMFERVRSGGAHAWVHLSGNVTAILPDLVEVGLNVLNPVQPQAMYEAFLEHRG